MALAASSTTNRLSDTAMSRLYFDLSEFTASTIDWVNARSFVALGATMAILNGAAAAEGVVPPEPDLVVVLSFLLLHAAAISPSATTGTMTRVNRRAFRLLICLPSSRGGSPSDPSTPLVGMPSPVPPAAGRGAPRTPARPR